MNTLHFPIFVLLLLGAKLQLGLLQGAKVMSAKITLHHMMFCTLWCKVVPKVNAKLPKMKILLINEISWYEF